MPFEPGNQYGKGNAKAQKLTGVIERAILQDDGKRIRQGVEKLLDLASGGDLAAMTFIRDTWQGKPQQSIELSGGDDKPLFQAIKMVIVANNPNQINGLVNDPATIDGEIVKEKITVSDNLEGQGMGVGGPVDETPPPHLRVPHPLVADQVFEGSSVNADE